MSCFGFLYDHPCANGYGVERNDYRVYKARTVAVAALKMARFIERRGWEPRDVCVDYEADHEGAYIDLYQLTERHPLYSYLP